MSTSTRSYSNDTETTSPTTQSVLHSPLVTLPFSSPSTYGADQTQFSTPTSPTESKSPYTHGTLHHHSWLCQRTPGQREPRLRPQQPSNRLFAQFENRPSPTSLATLITFPNINQLKPYTSSHRFSGSAASLDNQLISIEMVQAV